MSFSCDIFTDFYVLSCDKVYVSSLDCYKDRSDLHYKLSELHLTFWPCSFQQMYQIAEKYWYNSWSRLYFIH